MAGMAALLLVERIGSTQRTGLELQQHGRGYPRLMQLHGNAKVELLKSVPLFASCSKADLRQIAMLADEVDRDEGRTLIREGERAREFFVVVEGSLRVTRKGDKVGSLGAGDVVGEIALVTDMPRTATVTTSQPGASARADRSRLP